MPTYKNWFVTLHDKKSEYTFSSIRESIGDTQYLLMSKEMGKEGKTPHFHLYVQFKQKMSKQAVCDKLSKAHWEPAKGTPAQNKTYIEKEHIELFEEGVPCTQGHRQDLDDFADSMVAGELSLTQLAEESPRLYIQYGKRFKELQQQLLNKKEWKKPVISHQKLENIHPEQGDFIYNGSWAGYMGQDKVFIFPTGMYGLDVRPLMFPCSTVHNGYESIPFRTKLIVIVENFS